jgi:hypothetical protein
LKQGANDAARVTAALEKLHKAMDSPGPPAHVAYTSYVTRVPIERSGYKGILKALREFVQAGGKPFEDEEFRRFFESVLFRTGLVHYNDGYSEDALEFKSHSEQQDFVKTVVRICGGKWEPDGAISLAGLSPRKLDRD